MLGEKMTGIKGWMVLNSGILSYSESLMDTFFALMNQAEDNDPTTVRRLLESALRVEMQKFLADGYLTPFGIDMPTFLSRTGSGNFTDERWNELHRAMLDYSEQYNVELLVSGWGASQEKLPERHSRALLYSVSRNGVTSHSDEGFYTCGSGSPTAHSMLSFFNYERSFYLPRAIYCVAAAKFMAERTAGVGKTTVLRVASRAGSSQFKGYYIQPDELEKLRKVWEASGMPRMTEEAEDLIAAIVSDHQGSAHVSMEHMARNVNKAIRQAASQDT